MNIKKPNLTEELKALRIAENAYYKQADENLNVIQLESQLRVLKTGHDMAKVLECEGLIAGYLPKDKRNTITKLLAANMRKAKQHLARAEAAHYHLILDESQESLIADARDALHKIGALQELALIRANPIFFWDVSRFGKPPLMDTNAIKALASEIRG